MSILRSRDRRLYNKDLAPTDNQPLFEGANEVQTQYHAQFAPNVQEWWREVRGS